MTLPQTDVTLETLALYLQAKLNAEQPGTIAAIRAFDDIPSDPSAYPCLIMHRTTSKGEAFQDCTGKIRYMLISQTERQARPGQFRWIELAIARAFRLYNTTVDFTDQVATIKTGSLRSDYKIGTMGGAFVPILEIVFEFGDYHQI